MSNPSTRQEGAATPQWLPVDSAPVGEDLLVFFPDAVDWAKVMICHLFDQGGDWYQQDGDNCPHPLKEITATHWMPLPNPPKAEGQS